MTLCLDSSQLRPIVRSFETDDVLDGTPSDELVRESKAARATTQGVVAAYLDADDVWQHVPIADQRRLMEDEGRDVVPVYVVAP